MKGRRERDAGRSRAAVKQLGLSDNESCEQIIGAGACDSLLRSCIRPLYAIFAVAANFSRLFRRRPNIRDSLFPRRARSILGPHISNATQ